LVPRGDGRGNRPVLAVGQNDGPREGQPVRLTLIDGNRNGEAVLFDHEGHLQRLGGDPSCGVCHHRNMPLDQNTSCTRCHRDMYEPTRLFDHSTHVEALEGNRGCIECHPSSEGAKTYETATACAECHWDQPPPGPIIRTSDSRWAAAPGYMDAMHGLCIACHEEQRKESPESYPASLDRCDTCHDADRTRRLILLAPGPPSTRKRETVKDER
ncbi:MAG TPA: hypothetical protein EYP56_19460, partial [Planctomycetaceae bacterium]|nr:hypothetical protein [Planctomycetaceae bacterium]